MQPHEKTPGRWYLSSNSAFHAVPLWERHLPHIVAGIRCFVKRFIGPVQLQKYRPAVQMFEPNNRLAFRPVDYFDANSA